MREIFDKDQTGSVTMDVINEIEKYGRGELFIEDYGLADLKEGQKARMVYMKFKACISWLK